MFGLGWPELLIILAVALLLFGGSRLAGVGKGTGRAIREFKEETRGLRDTEKDEKAVKEAQIKEAQIKEAQIKEAQIKEAQIKATGAGAPVIPVEGEIIDDTKRVQH